MGQLCFERLLSGSKGPFGMIVARKKSVNALYGTPREAGGLPFSFGSKMLNVVSLPQHQLRFLVFFQQ
jgi:hypothetical protein